MGLDEFAGDAGQVHFDMMVDSRQVKAGVCSVCEGRDVPVFLAEEGK